MNLCIVVTLLFEKNMGIYKTTENQYTDLCIIIYNFKVGNYV